MLMDMREALLLIRHCLKNSSLICSVFCIDNSGDSLKSVFFVANFCSVATKETTANYTNLAVLGGKRKQESPYLEEKKQSHGAI
jgi:hypothetical protein